MAMRLHLRVLSASAGGLLAACSSSFDGASLAARPIPPAGQPAAPRPRSAIREPAASAEARPSALGPDAGPEEYVRYALTHSPKVEAAHQAWLAAAARIPQVGGLPDPQLTLGFFFDQAGTETSPQVMAGVQQSIPWPGKLRDREDAASRAAAAAWRRVEAERLAVAERVVTALHDLAYLDAAVGITGENLDLLRSFEEVVRARYRVGVGSHPDLIRVQVELGQIEDRLTQLRAMRPAYAAELNATLNRPAETEVPGVGRLPGRVADADADTLAALAAASSPALLALDEQAEEQRVLTDAARKEAFPGFMIGVENISTARSISAVAGEGEDPIMLTVGLTLPVWRERYAAGVREAIARRLAIAHGRADEANRIAAAVHMAWFEHTDADRRVGLYERTLIPKAEESLRASLAGFRAGETDFLAVLDTERTLLEFSLAGERARADRGKALARLGALVGGVFPTTAADEQSDPEVLP